MTFTKIESGAVAPGAIAENDLAIDVYTTAETDGLITPANVSGKLNDATDYFMLPKGTTAQRPASPVIGSTRFNTDLNAVETYHGSVKGWAYLSNILQATGGTITEGSGYRYHVFYSSGTFTVQGGTGLIDYLIVAGGGGGATDGDVGGGGGGGGLITGSLTVSAQNYSIVVGAGGAGGTSSYTPGTGGGGNGSQGGTSSAFGLTAIGGGRGGTRSNAGGAGGSGGGGGDGGAAGGTGTSGQGYAGGTAPAMNSNGGWDQGGGGGAGGAASSWLPGPGISSNISGSTVIYAKGGSGSAGTGAQGVQAPANTGQGGRGGATTSDTTGGSGIVIIRYSI